MSRLEKKNLCIETVEQSSSNDPGMLANGILVSSSSDERMRLEVEPTLRFRGRTPGDFKRKKATNGDGEELTARPPRYFADRNGKTCLYLLVCLGFFNCSIEIIIFFQIPEKFLSPNAEHRLEFYLITREIQGCSYVHPYFNFQFHPSNMDISDENPMYVPFSMNNLEDYLDGVKKLL